MNTAKNDIFIGLQPEYCYLVGEINLWWWQKIKIVWWGEWGGRGSLLGGDSIDVERDNQK